MANELNPQTIVAWVNLAQQLALLGINAANGIKNAVKALQPDVTDDQLNKIVQAVIDDAQRRKILAEADANGGVHPAAASGLTGTAGKLSPTGQPQAAKSPVPTPPPGAGPTGTDGVTDTSTANADTTAAAGKDGAHSSADRPEGGLPGTVSK